MISLLPRLLTDGGFGNSDAANGLRAPRTFRERRCDDLLGSLGLRRKKDNLLGRGAASRGEEDAVRPDDLENLWDMGRVRRRDMPAGRLHDGV